MKFDKPSVRDGDVVEFQVRFVTKIGAVTVHRGLVWARTSEGIEHGPLAKWRLVKRDPEPRGP